MWEEQERLSRESGHEAHALWERYRVRIRGHLDPSWSDWFDGLAIVQERDGSTTLSGPVADQEALYGVLARLRDLGATLLAVERIPPT